MHLALEIQYFRTDKNVKYVIWYYRVF